MPGASDHVERCARICAERAWRFACSLMGNAADADDVVQEAFVIAARKAHAIPNDDPWPWFAAVLANVARNARRKRAHAARFGHRPGDDAMSGLSGHDPDPADAMADEEFAKYLRESLAGLPDAEREAVTITAIAGLSYRDAAEVLGVPFGTLTSRVHQGLATLRQRLGRPEEAIVRTLGVLPFAPPPGGFEAAAAYWANAATLNVSGSTTLGLKLLGGAIMTKYVGAVVVALVLLLAAWLILHDPDDGLAGGTEKNTPLMADGDSDIQPPRDPSRSAFSVPSETPQLSDPASSTADTPAEAETRPVEIPDPVPPAEVKRDKPAEQTPTVPPQPSSGDPYADAPFPVVKNGKILGSRPRWDAGSEVLSVAFSHDGARVVSGNRNGVVHLWDVATGSIIGEFSGHR
ncbi:MAG: sigma-70 family RNA polymerase sigma factor, partial [Planctomycetes bacterium]|nr:sigma-70 family RNA polymerase sigma factor [Planctomycetota bacterium]